MINFDNAATTFPKPESVKSAVLTAFSKYGGNPGRSGHKLSMQTAMAIYNARNICADFFGSRTENVIFTQNCTHALNFAIKGLLSDGGHVIISDLEHNSVARPVFSLSSKKDCSFDIAKTSENDNITVYNFEKLIQSDTKAIVCTIASNVTGQILPFKKIGELCKKYGICFIADGAQACGIIPLKLSDGINILCTSGHKGLYGTTGTGLMITDGQFPLSTIMEGGTGSSSFSLEQPDFLPDRFESGTVNTVGVLSLGAGISFVNKIGINRIFAHEQKLCDMFIKGISSIEGIKIYRKPNCNYVPIVSFNLCGVSPEELSKALSDRGFALRGGLHCAPLAHKTIGSAPEGTVRFAPSFFNTEEQVYAIVKTLKQLKK